MGLLVCVEDPVCDALLVHGKGPSFATSISQNHAHRVLHSRFPPFGFVLKPVWLITMFLNMILADSCWKSFFKTSISRNDAYRVLHSRFPLFGFVLKPVW